MLLTDTAANGYANYVLDDADGITLGRVRQGVITVLALALTAAAPLFDKAYWRDVGLAGAAVSYHGPFSEVHDHSGPGGSPAALFGFAAAAPFDGATPEQIGAAFADQLYRLFGAAAATPRHVHVTDWSAERYTSPRAPSPRAATTGYGHPL